MFKKMLPSFFIIMSIEFLMILFAIIWVASQSKIYKEMKI